jgi:hypothetical protein
MSDLNAHPVQNPRHPHDRSHHAMDPTDTPLRAAFDLGLATARDPANRAAVRGSLAVTTLDSPWLYRPCPVCAHSFRVGDPVQIGVQGGADRLVRHHSPQLPCTGEAVAAATRPAELAAFIKGLDITWPPPAGLDLHCLAPGHPLLAAPRGGFGRHTCAVCGHTLRPHDQVVICPCRPSAPMPMCRIAIHRDPLHGLSCWDAWCPDGRAHHCLATSRPLDP